MKLGLLVAVFVCLGFCQSSEPQTIFERHGVLELSTTQALPTNAYSVQKMDILMSYITTTRHDVNQYDVVATYEYEGVRLCQVISAKVRPPGATLVTFDVPRGIKNIKIKVTAGRFVEIESREFGE